MSQRLKPAFFLLACTLTVTGVATFIALRRTPRPQQGEEGTVSLSKVTSQTSVHHQTQHFDTANDTDKEALRRALLDLKLAIQAGDIPSIDRLSDFLRKGRSDTVAVIVEDLLAITSRKDSDKGYWVRMMGLLRDLSGTETALLLLESYKAIGALDIKPYTFEWKHFSAVLEDFNSIICLARDRTITDKAMDLLRHESPLNVLARQYLFYLLGALSLSDHNLLALLKDIMLRDPNADMRALAADTLAKYQPTGALPELTQGLASLLTSQASVSRKEVSALTRACVKAASLEVALRLLSTHIQDAKNSMAVQDIGLELGAMIESGELTTADPILTEAMTTNSANMQLLALAVFSSMGGGRKDPLVLEIVKGIYESSQDDGVKQNALTNITLHSQDEAQMLYYLQAGADAGGRLRQVAITNLVVHVGKHPESAVSAEVLRNLCTSGDPKSRIQVINALDSMLAVKKETINSMLRTLLDTENDPTVRAAITARLKSNGQTLD